MKFLLLLLGAVCGSLAGIFGRYADAAPQVLVFFRMSFTLIFMIPLLMQHRGEFANLPRKGLFLSLASGCFLGIHFLAFFYSVTLTSLASSAVLTSTEVLFVALASGLFLRQKLSRRAWLAVMLAFAGSAIVAMADTSAASNALLGDCLGLAAGLFMAIYTMIGSVCRRTLSTTVYTFFVYLAAWATVGLATLLSGTPFSGYGSSTYLAALALAVFCTLMGHSLFSWALRFFPPTLISTVKLLDPVFSALWGLLLFSERPGLTVLLGGILILGGIGIYIRADASQTTQERTL